MSSNLPLPIPGAITLSPYPALQFIVEAVNSHRHPFLFNNDPPDDSEKERIKSLIPAARADLERLRTSHAPCPNSDAHWDDQPYTNAIALHQSSLSPIRFVPPEIISLVMTLAFTFGQLFDDDILPIHLPAPWDMKRGPWYLGQICRSWRRIAIGTLSLWTNIHIILTADEDEDDVGLLVTIMKTYLQRSGDAILRVRIDVGYSWSEEEAHKVLFPLLKTCYRWISLKLLVNHIAVSIMSLPDGMILDQLKSVSLEFDRPFNKEPSTANFRFLQQNFRRLSLQTIYLSSKSSGSGVVDVLPFSTILYLSYCISGRGILCLSQCQNLQYLFLGGRHTKLVEPVILPSLRCLILQSPTVSCDAIRHLSFLSLPSLEILRIDMKYLQDEIAGLASIISSSKIGVKRLEFRDDMGSMAEFYLPLKSFVNSLSTLASQLEVLYITQEVMSPREWRLLISDILPLVIPSPSSNPLPALRSVRFTCSLSSHHDNTKPYCLPIKLFDILDPGSSDSLSSSGRGTPGSGTTSNIRCFEIHVEDLNMLQVPDSVDLEGWIKKMALHGLTFSIKKYINDYGCNWCEEMLSDN